MARRKLLGKKVREVVTGLEGIAVAKIDYMNGCRQYSIQPQVCKDGVPAEAKWWDAEQVELLKDKKVVSKKKKPTGGPPPSNTKGMRI
jgi:hypothetical protein